MRCEVLFLYGCRFRQRDRVMQAYFYLFRGGIRGKRGIVSRATKCIFCLLCFSLVGIMSGEDGGRESACVECGF